MKRLVNWMMAAFLICLAFNARSEDLPLGPSDVIKISVYGVPDLALETRISEAGVITFPLIGAVPVAGLPVAAAEKKIAGLLENGGFVRKAQVNIIVTQIQSQQVSVLGQVNRPGRYPLDGRRSVMDLLALAGGIAADGGDTINLIRKRDGKTTKTVLDVIQMVRSGDLVEDVLLTGGDVIYVERSPRFYIYGEVQRPGMFRLERSMTVVQALSAGGGLSARGTERGLVIKRRDASGKVNVVDVKQDDLLQNDDVVYVKESLF